MLNCINQLNLSYAATTYGTQISVFMATEIDFSLMSHITGSAAALLQVFFMPGPTEKDVAATQGLLRHPHNNDTITRPHFYQPKQIS